VTATEWPSSDYAAKCAWCGQPLATNERRVREDVAAPGVRGKRTWHPECYAADPVGSPAQGPPRAAADAGAPRGARGTRPPTPTSTPTPSTPPASSGASPPARVAAPAPSETRTEDPAWRPSTPREAGWCWVTVEAEAEVDLGHVGGRGLVRIAEIVPVGARDDTVKSFRAYVVRNAIAVANDLAGGAPENAKADGGGAA